MNPWDDFQRLVRQRVEGEESAAAVQRAADILRQQEEDEAERLRREGSQRDAELARRMLPLLLARPETGERILLRFPDIERPQGRHTPTKRQMAKYEQKVEEFRQRNSVTAWPVGTFSYRLGDMSDGTEMTVELYLAGDGKLYRRWSHSVASEIPLENPPISLYDGLVELATRLRLPLS